MRLTPLLRPDLILCPLRGTAKDAVFEELAAVAASALNGLGTKDILEILHARERQGPFSMGKHIAFLHARTDRVKDFHIAVGTAPAGLDFGAPDGKPIRLVVLLIVPRKHSNLYLYAMAGFLNLLSNEGTLETIVSARTPEEFLRLFDEAQARNRQKSTIEEFLQPTVFLRASQTLGQAIETVLETKSEQVPVVDDQNQLLGEITLATLLRLKGTTAKDRRLDELSPEFLTSPRLAVQDTTPPEELVKRLSGEGPAVAYVLRGRLLLGQVNLIEFLRRMIVRGQA